MGCAKKEEAKTVVMTETSQEIRVLVVDDSPVSRKLLERSLAEAPYTLSFAKDGADALRLFAERPPDLVIAVGNYRTFPAPSCAALCETSSLPLTRFSCCSPATRTKRASPKGWQPARPCSPPQNPGVEAPEEV